MSDQKSRRPFEAAAWGAAGTAGSGAAFGEAGKNGGFRALYSDPKKKESPETFVASFVSEEKARALAKSKEPVNVARPEREVLEEVKRRAWEEAFARGESAGLEEGRGKSREIIDRLQNILTDVEAAWTNLIKANEKRIIELVCRITEKVVYGQAALDQEMVKRAIIEALRVIPEPVNVQITVNPKDYEYIETIKEDFFSHIKGLKDVSVTPDSAIHPGGCTVRTRSGEVDATLESRLEAVRECLLQACGRKRSA